MDFLISGAIYMSGPGLIEWCVILPSNSLNSSFLLDKIDLLTIQLKLNTGDQDNHKKKKVKQ